MKLVVDTSLGQIRRVVDNKMLYKGILPVKQATKYLPAMTIPFSRHFLKRQNWQRFL